MIQHMQKFHFELLTNQPDRKSVTTISQPERTGLCQSVLNLQRRSTTTLLSQTKKILLCLRTLLPSFSSLQVPCGAVVQKSALKDIYINEIKQPKLEKDGSCFKENLG